MCVKSSHANVYQISPHGTKPSIIFPHTCRNDPDAQRAGEQRLVRTVWIHAAVNLRPPNQTVDDLTEHAVPPDTHHTELGSEVTVTTGKKQKANVFLDQFFIYTTFIISPEMSPLWN